jgi:hypothetical protein
MDCRRSCGSILKFKDNISIWTGDSLLNLFSDFRFVIGQQQTFAKEFPFQPTKSLKNVFSLELNVTNLLEQGG